jgi:hypothetical protein
VQMPEIGIFKNCFSKGKPMDQVHEFVDRGRHQYTMERQWRGPKALEHGDALTGAWPSATPWHRSSPAGAQQREGNSARASPGLGRRRGGRAWEGNSGGSRCSMGWELQTRERAKEDGVSVVMAGGAPRPFIVVREGHTVAREGETAGSNGLNAIDGGGALMRG